MSINTDFKILFESSPGLYLVILPADFKIVAVSEAYLQATMTKREEISGRNLFDVFPDNPDDPGATGEYNLRSSLNTVLQTKTAHTMAVQKYDIRNPEGNFEERFWSPLNKPVLNASGGIEYIIHRVEDVTPFVQMKKEQASRDKIAEDLRERVEEMEMEIFRRAQEIQESNKKLQNEVKLRGTQNDAILQLNSELEKSLDQIQRINKELESFSYSVSHDLRAPLRAINGYVKILWEDYSQVIDEEGKRVMNVISNNAKKMSQLIDDLLAFSYIGKQQLVKSPIDMNAMVYELVKDFKEQSQKKEIEIKVKPMTPVHGDINMIRQVMVNLLSNAIKYAGKKEKARIEIGSHKEKKGVAFYVKDNGVGFDMKYYDKLFGIFQRLHSSAEFEGTGIGLAIVQRIVDKHNGKVWASSAVNQGSTFNFLLPEN